MKHQLRFPLLFAALTISSCNSDDSEASEKKATEEQESFQALELAMEGEKQAKETQEMIDQRSENARNILSALDKNPTAKPVPSRPGYVFNPWTNKIVEVRGLPPGTLVRDPADPVPNRKFRTPTP